MKFCRLGCRALNASAMPSSQTESSSSGMSVFASISRLSPREFSDSGDGFPLFFVGREGRAAAGDAGETLGLSGRALFLGIQSGVNGDEEVQALPGFVGEVTREAVNELLEDGLVVDAGHFYKPHLGAGGLMSGQQVVSERESRIGVGFAVNTGSVAH
jgi:hypothetical protein